MTPPDSAACQLLQKHVVQRSTVQTCKIFIWNSSHACKGFQQIPKRSGRNGETLLQCCGGDVCNMMHKTQKPKAHPTCLCVSQSNDAQQIQACALLEDGADFQPKHPLRLWAVISSTRITNSTSFQEILTSGFVLYKWGTTGRDAWPDIHTHTNTHT